MFAHCLTALRLLLAFPAAYSLAAPSSFASWVPLACILMAIATDVADGKVARAQGTASAGGMLFDHSTDCLFVSACLFGAAYAGSLPLALAPLVVFAFLQYVLDSRFLHRQKQLRMSKLGRWNGVFYFAPPLILALARVSPQSLDEVLNALAWWGAWALVLSTLLSILDRALARPVVTR